MNYIVCNINMFDMYQRIGLFNADKQCTIWQNVAEIDNLPKALVDACQANVVNTIRLGGGHPDWDGLVDAIHAYCKTQYGFDGSQLNIELI